MGHALGRRVRFPEETKVRGMSVSTVRVFDKMKKARAQYGILDFEFTQQLFVCASTELPSLLSKTFRFFAFSCFL